MDSVKFVDIMHSAPESDAKNMVSEHLIPESIAEGRDLMTKQARVELSRAYVPCKAGAPRLSAPVPEIALGYSDMDNSLSRNQTRYELVFRRRSGMLPNYKPPKPTG
ncbi:hypothetical protein GMORB2_0236 [Geosmithia morbida]|uniref:Uncharacterized protein n=1 Tax=Geosmithia morbida TaxID=1094350 RepID=A0A9P5D874_9HYPO|nr:uncharacterized protein GMORB2_0236 [Geosmithia morbida]KAF4126500.1 hypothetical protein GMORB2_0236 [Geosmithia morbida]